MGNRLIAFALGLALAAATVAGEPAAPPPPPPPPVPATAPAPSTPAPAAPSTTPAAPSTAVPAGPTTDLEAAPQGSILGKNLWETFLAGGPLMWPILLCSLVGLAFAIERFVSLRQSAVVPAVLAREVPEVVATDGPSAASSLCSERPSCLARVLGAGLAAAGEPKEEIVKAMEEAGERELWHLNRLAKPLSVIAGVAPLLGLLGTVQGMIMAFEVVARKGAMGDPRQLASGIATALLTTFAGLSVAIPCYVLYHYFRDKSDRMIVEIEDTAIRLADALKGSSGNANPPPTR